MALRSVSREKKFRFEKGRHDVRGWDVRTSVDDEKIGRVDDVIIDESDRTRYIDLELSDRNEHVLLPPGQARLDTSSKVVWVPGMSKKSFADVPAYPHDPATIDREYEQRLSTAYDAAYTDEHHYERPDYNADWSSGRSDATAGHVGRLDELDDFKVASHEDDPRGWKVVGADDETLGKVDHLIGDTGAMKVRYLEMKVDRGLFKDDRHVLLPAAHVALNRDDKHVRVAALTADRTKTLPAYDGGAIDRGHEAALLRTFSDSYTDDRHYAHPRYRDEHLHGDREERIQRSEEEVSVGTRRVQAGEVEVKKRVEEERIREPVTVHREEVEVERRPASGQTARGRTELKDDEIRMPVTEEEVVVEKRPVVKEEIVVRKRDVADTEMVDERVRKEHVDVETRGDVESDRNRKRSR